MKWFMIHVWTEAPVSNNSLIHVLLERKVLLAQIWKWSIFSYNICGCYMMLYLFHQVRTIMLCQDIPTSSICNTQHVATSRNRVAKLAQQCDMSPQNVAIACVGLENAGPTMLRCPPTPALNHPTQFYRKYCVTSSLWPHTMTTINQ